MEKEAFEDTLRRYLRHQPFLPFVVELENGEQIVVGQPSIAFCEGFALFLNPADELVEFGHEEVHSIHLFMKEHV
jgi:hypothetical protein